MPSFPTPYRQGRIRERFTPWDRTTLSLLFLACWLPASLLQPAEIDHREQEFQAITVEERQVISDLETLNQDLNQARRQAADIRTDIHDLDNLMVENRDKSRELSKEIALIEARASRRIVALYKLNQLGLFNLLASADTLYDIFYRKTALEKILHQDQEILATLQSAQNELTVVRQHLEEQKRKKDALEQQLNSQILAMDHKQQKRSRLLQDIRSQKALTLAAIESLKQSSEALDTTIGGFKKEDPGKHPYDNLTPQAFEDLKGLLIMPVKGKIVEFFGPYKNTEFNLVNFRNGISIRAERGEPIHAVYKGRTLYANWFKGYGNMIIIDHGNHYYTLYAHAEELFKKKGDPVEAGEVIATVGDTGSMAKSGLYFEVRHHSKPIDPSPWLNQG